ncbi:hypothetical protein AB0I98_31455 [Streptomyces sp. NPDC050211]|uniref:hypothetical protein n=1 Tax=Streptomyces sp. NPDC050211 TaxID=3154932 RepID=UPI00343FFE3C
MSVSRRGTGTSPPWCPLVRPPRSAPVPGSAVRGGVPTGSDEVESSTLDAAIGPAVPLSGVVAGTGDTGISCD